MYIIQLAIEKVMFKTSLHIPDRSWSLHEYCLMLFYLLSLHVFSSLPCCPVLYRYLSLLCSSSLIFLPYFDSRETLVISARSCYTAMSKNEGSRTLAQVERSCETGGRVCDQNKGNALSNSLTKRKTQVQKVQKVTPPRVIETRSSL